MDTILSYIHHVQDCDDPFHVVDLGQVLELHRDWMTALPTITPFYAVKCNNDPALLKTLAALGTGFDCASKVCTCRLDLLFLIYCLTLILYVLYVARD